MGDDQETGSGGSNMALYIGGVAGAAAVGGYLYNRSQINTNIEDMIKLDKRLTSVYALAKEAAERINALYETIEENQKKHKKEMRKLKKEITNLKLARSNSAKKPAQKPRKKNKNRTSGSDGDSESSDSDSDSSESEKPKKKNKGKGKGKPAKIEQIDPHKLIDLMG